MLSPNSILQNRYRVVRELGHGGMGTVYEAVDQRVNCIVALKETIAGDDEEARRAFEREASLLGNLRHSTLPKVMDYFTEGGGDFLVMEFIPGYDLAELLDSRGNPFSQSQVLRWADELLRVLEYLHGHEPPILHRDIKPSNLKLTKQGEIFLLDFGLAKGSFGQMPTLATSRSVRGYTPVYASLEQIHGQGTDARSDLYSLGATLYHLLTGVAPADAPTRFHLVEDDHPDPLRPIAKVNPDVSNNVAEVIHQAMAISRKHRPISAAVMRKSLRNAAEEDERSSAEEEYRRAEARRRERDEEASGSLSKAKTRALEPKQREEAKPRPAVPPTVPGPTVGPATPPPKKVEAPPPVKTIVAPPPERASLDRLSPSTNRSFESLTTPAPGKSHALLIAVVIVGVVLGGILIVWLLTRTTGEDTANNSSTADNSGAKTVTGPKAPAGMVYVPGGTFTMGRDNGADEAERPEHQVTVQPFFIDMFEARGIYADSHPDERQSYPVIGATWADAKQYCASAGKRLPTEEEWEFAARGTDGRIYPWGNNWQEKAANAAGESSSVAKGGAYNGASPFGAFDMIGNVWEWTSSDFRPYPGGRLPPVAPGELKVIRGGSYESTRAYATTTYRTGWPARGAKTYDQTGFRCVKDVQ